MHEQHPTSRRRDSVPSGDARERPPSAVAQARLSEALRDRTQTYRQDASVDLTMLGALLRLDHPEAAAKALDDHRASLRAMAHDLQVAVADAAVEREAERVCSAVAQAEVHRPLVSNVRRRVLAVTGAAAVVLALVLPTARFSPRTTLTSVEGRSAYDDISAARERLEAARTWARALRADTISQRSEARAAAPSPVADAVVRSTLRPSLAADDSGGSAASTVNGEATVTDLESYRASKKHAAQRDPEPPTTPEPPPDPPAAPEPPVGPAPAPPVNVRLPDVEVDASGETAALGGDPSVDLSAATGADVDAALPGTPDVDLGS